MRIIRAIAFNCPAHRSDTMRRPVKRALVAIAVMFTLIFSQLWISAYACTTVTGDARGTSSMVSAIPANSHGDLQDHHVGVTCHAHCDNSAQPDHADQPVPAPLVWLPLIWGHSSILTLALQPDRPAHVEPLLVSAPPPSRILFQVFRT
ncbi:hypothetical protein D7191_40465 [Burkholderia cepacia]|nr:hypothetical protein [Burkholderia cepacia]MBB0082698.1 hypothetical protein [Burkholderia cepacia]MBB0117943.1 hypothetical protein [Burkholderia cepacia]MBB0125817.1 hypothetical protein [Burkholderia cepacia]QFR15832.1 hypothetical protein SK875_p00193 [Burkholderia contaminans]